MQSYHILNFASTNTPQVLSMLLPLGAIYQIPSFRDVKMCIHHKKLINSIPRKLVFRNFVAITTSLGGMT